MASCKITVVPVYSPNSDYDPNLVTLQDYDETLSSPTKFAHIIQSVPLASYTYDLAQFTTVDEVYVKNLSSSDSSAYVTATFTTTGGACVVYLPVGRSFRVPQAVVANDLVLDATTAACTCEIFIAGT